MAELQPRHDKRPLSFPVPSKAVPRPVDDEGIEMLSNHEVGEAFGLNHHNSKKIGYREPIRQYKVYPTKDFEEHDDNTGQHARTWFSLSDVVTHLGKAAEKDPSKKAALTFHTNRLKQARKIEAARIAKGGEVYHVGNQPHPENKKKGFRVGVREWTDEREGMTKNEFSPSSAGATDSNLDNPYKYGKFTTVEDRGDPK